MEQNDFLDIREKGRRRFLRINDRRIVNLKPALYRRYPWLVFGFFFVIFSVLASRQFLFGRAEQTVIHPNSCLGDWIDPQKAQGPPEAGTNSGPEDANTQNSALFNDLGQKIFCGNFVIPETKGEFKKAALKLYWRVVLPTSTISELLAPSSTATSTPDDGLIVPLEPIETTSSEQTTVSDQNSESAVAETPASEAPTASLLESFDSLIQNQTSGVSEIESSSGQSLAETPTEPPTEPVAEPETQSAETQSSEPSVSSSTEPAIESENQPAEIQPPAQPENSSTSGFFKNSLRRLSLFNFFVPTALPVVFAQEAGASQALEFYGEPINLPDASSSASADFLTSEFLQISYSLDNEHWLTIAKIHPQNWENAVIDLPIASWDDLNNLQIKIEGLASDLFETPKVFLEALAVLIDYAPPSILGGLSLSQNFTVIVPGAAPFSDLPQIILPPDQDILTSTKKEWSPQETPVLEFDLNRLTPSP